MAQAESAKNRINIAAMALKRMETGVSLMLLKVDVSVLNKKSL
jgi:hypothetical protein